MHLKDYTVQEYSLCIASFERYRFSLSGHYNKYFVWFYTTDRALHHDLVLLFLFMLVLAYTVTDIILELFKDSHIPENASERL